MIIFIGVVKMIAITLFEIVIDIKIIPDFMKNEEDKGDGGTLGKCI